MNREEWQIHMDLAERCVAEGLAQIEKQQRLIRELEGNGRDATSAKAFLATLLESQGGYGGTATGSGKKLHRSFSQPEASEPETLMNSDTKADSGQIEA